MFYEKRLHLHSFGGALAAALQRCPLGGTKSAGQTASGGRFNYNIQRLGIRAALRGLRAFPPSDRIDAARQDTWFRNAHNHGIA